MKTFYGSTIEQVVKQLNSDKYRGLSYKDLKENINSYGENNIVVSIDKISFKEVFLKLDYLVGLVGIILALGFKIYDALIFMTIILGVRLAISISDYTNKKKKTKQIESINYTDVNVIRSGTRDVIRADDLTVGDIVFLKKGDIISADIRIVEDDNLYVNERNITSVDADVRKYSARIERVKSLSEISNMVFRGTRVMGGSAKGIVVSIGNDTQIGRLLEYINKSKASNKSMDKFLENESKSLNIFIFILAIFMSILILVLNMEKRFEYVVMLWFIATSLNYKMVQLIYFSIRKKALEKDKIYIDSFRKLERFSLNDIFFMTKVGCIANAKMNLKAIYTLENFIDDTKFIDKKNVNIERILSIGILNNNSIFDREKNKYSGSPIDGAILEFCNSVGIFKGTMIAKNKPIFSINDDAKISSSINKMGKNYRASVKGYVDEVLEKCKYIMIDSIEREITDEDIEKIRMMDFNISNKGYETVGFAYRNFSYLPSEDENIESNLVFVGIVGFENEILDNSKELITKLKARKILPVLITDDNKIVATRLGIELGIARGMEEVMSGVELLSLEKDELINVLSRTRVFCRITPAIKSKIIKIFTKEGYKVASMGENLSDMPSISISNIGIASGKKIAKLLEKMSSVKIIDDVLLKFINIIDESDKIMKAKERTSIIYKYIFSIECVIMLICMFMNFENYIYLIFVMFNMILLPLVMLIIYSYRGEKFSFSNLIKSLNFYLKSGKNED